MTFLAPTENIMIYQEQFIQMFNRLGLNFGQGDILEKDCRKSRS